MSVRWLERLEPLDNIGLAVVDQLPIFDELRAAAL